MSTFATMSRPTFSAASFSSSGATARHGPHQAAQKSTSTGVGAELISSSKSAALASGTGRANGKSGALQAAHFARSPDRDAGRRFDLEQAGQETNTGDLSIGSTCGRATTGQGFA